MKWENVVIAINYDLESFIAMKLEMTLIIKIMNMMLILLKFFINSYYSVYNLIFDIALHIFQLNISFNEKTEVFEYPSFESVDLDFKQSADKTMTESSNNQEQQSSSLFKSNSTVGSSGMYIFC